jgi:hypothetical protein
MTSGGDIRLARLGNLRRLKVSCLGKLLNNLFFSLQASLKGLLHPLVLAF